MTDDALRGAWAKFHRAVEHVQELGARENAWLAFDGVDGPALTIRSEVQEQPRRSALVVESLRSLGPEPSILIGDVLNNVRGALDYIAWQLYIRGTAYTGAESKADVARDRGVAWPLVPDPASWSKSAARLLPGVGQSVLTAIESLQPYNRHNASTALRWLAETHGREKHRDLQPGLFVLPEQGVRVHMSEPFYGRRVFPSNGGPLSVGAVLAEFHPMPGGARLPMNVGLEVSLRLGLGDGVPVMRHLSALLEVVLQVLAVAKLWLPLAARDDVLLPSPACDCCAGP